MKKIIYIMFLILVGACIVAATQKEDFVESLKLQLEKYNKVLPQEKAYVQTDKTYYIPGESIWYKGFILNSNTNKASNLSDVIYIDLKNPNGNVLQTHKHSVVEGVVNGDFYIPNTSAGGIYTLVAHSKWMDKVGNEQVFFKKQITVQRVITPHLLLILDFEKRAYGAGDEVEALLKITDLMNKPVNDAEVTATIRIAGNEIQKLKFTSTHGEVNVVFRLPEDLNSTDGILQLVVKDNTEEESITRSIPIVLNHISMQFYPEGGTLICGVKNRVAFEAKNEFNKGADVSGTIVDEAGTEITTFESFHLGMGSFSFTPQQGKVYSARITKPAVQDANVILPLAIERGYLLHLKTKTDDSLVWTIVAPQNCNVSFVSQTQGVIHYSKTIALHEGENTIEVNTHEFPIGISVFTLFDTQNNPVCERLVYVNDHKQLHISIKPTKDIYSPTGTTTVNVTTTDDDGKPVVASLGVAVVDEQLLTLADDKQDNILSSILFSSELKGDIQEPLFYFKHDEPKSKEAIDYLMLTHGWRRFVWKDIWNVPDTSFTVSKENDIMGYVLDVHSKPIQAEVYLIETSKGRVAKLTTTAQGFFVFHNVDQSAPLYVSTKLPNQVFVYNTRPSIAKSGSTVDSLNIPEHVVISELKDNTSNTKNESFSKDSRSITSNLVGSAKGLLSECIVIGYGSQTKSDLTTSVQIVGNRLLYSGSLYGALVGQIADVEPSDVSPNVSPNLKIRGTSTLMTNKEPLIVLDGVPLLGSERSALGFINPENIINLNVIKGAAATAIYGSVAANGVIVVTTYSNRGGHKRRKPIYGSVRVEKKEYYSARSFSLERGSNTTVFWDANVITNKDGKATFQFANNATSSSFRITAEGMANVGLIGSNYVHYATQKPFSIDSKAPLFAAVGDSIEIPVSFKNTTSDTLHLYVSIMRDHGDFVHMQDTLSYKIISGDEVEHINKKFKRRDIYNYSHELMEINIAPQQTYVNCFLLNESNNDYYYYYDNTDTYTIRAFNKEYNDVLRKSILIRNVYFPHSVSFSSDSASMQASMDTKGLVKGSMHARLDYYPRFIEELFDGVKSILRLPWGCFEQVSSCTLPNIFALQILNATPEGDEASRKKALKYIKDGYNRLAAFEVKGGGFEWYGGKPAHEVLSAYGLLEFYEMDKVYPLADSSMLKRTLHFILSRKDGEGGFLQNRGKYGFSAAPSTVNNAFIIYALLETKDFKKLGETNLDIDKEYLSSMDEAWKSKDMYRMALMANAAYDKGDSLNYRKLVTCFNDYISNYSFDSLKVETSIVWSRNQALLNETTSLWLMALLKANDSSYYPVIKKCVSYLNRNKMYGGYGNSQSTAMCLQALSKYLLKYPQTRDEPKGNISLYVNNSLRISYNIANTTREYKQYSGSIDFAKELNNGSNTINVEFTKKVYPYSVNASWQTKTPLSAGDCPLILETKLAKTTIKVNETVRLEVKLENKKSKGIPMSIAIVGMPGGLSLQPWQLKELQEKKVFDYYEIKDDNLVLYYREMGPLETKTINLDLKAEVRGVYQGIASSAYLYYNNEDKFWVNGLKVEIK